MKAVVSTTHDDRYLFFLPIITWCWNKLGVDVICFMPFARRDGAFNYNKGSLLEKVREDNGLIFSVYPFECPEHKEATYAQCSRLYAAALDLPDDEILITSDIDMALFKLPGAKNAVTGEYDFPFPQVIGSDLTPYGQFPMCYISATKKKWAEFMQLKGKTYQECLDDLLSHIEAQHFRGNYWGKDQETAFNMLSLVTDYPITKINRARNGTQFADHRVDRDDINWRSYCGPDLIDAHLWRPGYTDSNFANILELLQIQYPEDNFDWLINYRNEYIKLL